jgi:hypothetical protein
MVSNGEAALLRDLSRAKLDRIVQHGISGETVQRCNLSVHGPASGEPKIGTRRQIAQRDALEEGVIEPEDAALPAPAADMTESPMVTPTASATPIDDPDDLSLTWAAPAA